MKSPRLRSFVLSPPDFMSVTEADDREEHHLGFQKFEHSTPASSMHAARKHRQAPRENTR